MSVTARSPVTHDISLPAVTDDVQPCYSAPATFARRWFYREIIEVAVGALRFIDLIAIISASFLSFFLLRSQLPDSLALSHSKYALVGALLLPFVLQWCGLYQPRNVLSKPRTVRAVFRGAAAFTAMVLLIGAATDTLNPGSLLWGAIWLGMSFALFLATRFAVARGITVMIQRGRLRDIVAVVGVGQLADRLVDHLTTRHTLNPDRCPVEVVGIFDDRSERLPAGCRAASGGLDSLITLGEQGVIDRIVITLPWSADERLLDICRKLRALEIEISLCDDSIAFSSPTPLAAAFGEFPLLSLQERPLRQWGAATKRVEDIILASLGLLVFGPMMCLIALLIKLDAGGPALSRQRRQGLGNRDIEVYKFRTMRTQILTQTDDVQNHRIDARVTRLGAILRRTRLDELPQLVNVLKGDMSLVGPQPHPVEATTTDKLCRNIIDTYAQRYRVKPGMTSWALVHGYQGLSDAPEHLIGRFEFDLFYIENLSLLLDLKILFKTVTNLITTDNPF